MIQDISLIFFSSDRLILHCSRHSHDAHSLVLVPWKTSSTVTRCPCCAYLLWHLSPQTSIYSPAFTTEVQEMAMKRCYTICEKPSYYWTTSSNEKRYSRIGKRKLHNEDKAVRYLLVNEVLRTKNVTRSLEQRIWRLKY
jgi:hypothetical protein